MTLTQALRAATAHWSHPDTHDSPDRFCAAHHEGGDLLYRIRLEPDPRAPYLTAEWRKPMRGSIGDAVMGSAPTILLRLEMVARRVAGAPDEICTVLTTAARALESTGLL
jgi:hypothetical protein